MATSVKVSEFLDQFQVKLKLSFISSEVGLDAEIKLSRLASDSYEAADYFNVIRTSSVVVVGYQESRYIQKLSLDHQRNLFKTLFYGPVRCIICSQGNSIPDAMLRYCEEREIPVFQSKLSDSELLDNTRHFLSRALAEHVDEFGVYIEVYSLGIFITGKSAVGKSELALALISRGHRLISDDITRFSRIAPDVVEGQSPDLLTDFMEVRGLGVVNIRAMFGANSLSPRKTLRLIINMVQLTGENNHNFDRLGNNTSTREILGLEIPSIDLPVAPGRNLSVLVESAARNHILNMNGYNAAEDFIERQNKAIQKNSVK